MSSLLEREKATARVTRTRPVAAARAPRRARHRVVVVGGTERFHEALRRPVHAPRVGEDVESGNRRGARSTPTFFINGTRHDGPHDISGLRGAIRTAGGRSDRERQR